MTEAPNEEHSGKYVFVKKGPRDSVQKSEPASYNRLKKMAKKYLDLKTKDLKFDARHHRAASGAPIGRKR